MEKVEEAPNDPESEETEAIELILFQVSKCYVYLVTFSVFICVHACAVLTIITQNSTPPRKSAASYRADEWDVNKGEECIIRLEDKLTGELYALAFLRKGELHPVEPVIDSSRYFVLRIEENIGGRLRHAFIGIGFRERTEAYDFQAALHDHMKDEILTSKKLINTPPPHNPLSCCIQRSPCTNL
ncbi:adaptin ear-binding coat-associated protein [Salix suchowensis]|nr:adaptin ear-binding coat-associated protein [Salix suchowensis]